jgi:hypothetical protein
MRNTLAATLFVLLLGTTGAAAGVVFRVGDTVYVDGKEYTLEEWKKLRDSAAAAPAPAPKASEKPAVRAASCITPMPSDQFPGEDERFDCTGGLGALTREQILQAGWKIDFIDKIAGEKTGVYKYKLILSR